MARRDVLVGSIAAALALLVAAPCVMPYEIVRLGSAGDADIRATDINDSGHVVGFSFADLEAGNGFVYDGTSMRRLEGLKTGDRTIALAINNKGDIVGYNVDATTSEETAVLWSSNGIVDIGAALGASQSIARDINDNGVIVGQAAVDGPLSDGFIWDRDNGGRFVGTLDGRDGGVNRSVNSAGLVVGHSFFFGEPDQAHLVVPENGGYRSELISAPFPGIGVAAAINQNDVIVGHANRTFGPHTAAIFTPGQPDVFIDLGSLPGAASSEAYGVNDAGVIVGTAGDNPEWPTAHAFVFREGQMHDLNDLFVDAKGEWQVLLEASAINNAGQIVGHGITVDGNTSAFILIPARFLRGDCNDDGDVDVSDAVAYFRLCFSGVNVSCTAACDTDGDGEQCMGVTDGIQLLMYLFGDGSPPREPFPECGSVAGVECQTPQRNCR